MDKADKSLSSRMPGKAGKARADQLVFEQGLAESREQARRLIMAGQVLCADNAAVPKPGHPYPRGTVFSLMEKERFVSRGAYKLLTAIEYFNLSVAGKICLDLGASTGGFTDCLLQHGAAKVYAADVGHGQLHEKLRADPRVINIERLNLRHAPPDLIREPLDLLAADVSFISLTLVLPPCVIWLKPGGLAAALVKPQFELGPHQTVKGVVRDENLQKQAVDKVVSFCERELGLEHLGAVPSAVKGPKGNQEFMILLRKSAPARA